jgi:hypothetical protein
MEIAYLGPRLDNRSELVFRTLTPDGLAEGIFGPNFQFIDTQTVPEPGTLGTGLIGAIAIGIVRLKGRVS